MLSVRWNLIFGASFCLLSVIIGAFSAHALKSLLSEYSLGLFETAARYQMYHGLALLISGTLILNPLLSNKWLKFASIAFVFGTLIFCGSLYLLALTEIKWLGAITPIGGAGFISGWSFMIVAVLKARQPDNRMEIDT